MESLCFGVVGKPGVEVCAVSVDPCEALSEYCSRAGGVLAKPLYQSVEDRQTATDHSKFSAVGATVWRSLSAVITDLAHAPTFI